MKLTNRACVLIGAAVLVAWISVVLYAAFKLDRRMPFEISFPVNGLVIYVCLRLLTTPIRRENEEIAARIALLHHMKKTGYIK